MGRSHAAVPPPSIMSISLPTPEAQKGEVAKAPAVMSPEDNVTVAVNYASNQDGLADYGPIPDCSVLRSTCSSVENRRDPTMLDSCSGDETGLAGCSEADQARHHSKRQRSPKKAWGPVEKSAVKYDVNLTPGVLRNKSFLLRWRVGEAAVAPSADKILAPAAKPSREEKELRARRSPYRLRRGQAMAIHADAATQPLTDARTGNDAQEANATSSKVSNKEVPSNSCELCKHPPLFSLTHPDGREKVNPFLGDESVIWVPSSRSEWNDCVDEMTAVCAEASFRRYFARSTAVASQDQAGGAPVEASPKPRKRGRPKGKQPIKYPLPPLSREYIRDRLDIDDPLRGYQIRHRSGGWLQGFVVMTTFTTWSHYFKWDSMHPKSGMRSADEMTRPGWELSLALGAEMEQQPRSGDPHDSGVIWPTLAEIGIVGALGCGEYLLRMALDDVLRRDCYEYVVLQATDDSRAFYERFGFVRVGAITKYGTDEAFTENRQGSKIAGDARKKLPIVGYRHWTYSDESSVQLSKHGGPSYMMALRVDHSHTEPNEKEHHCTGCGRAISKISFIDVLSGCFVYEKPKIIPAEVYTRKRTYSLESFGPTPVTLAVTAENKSITATPADASVISMTKPKEVSEKNLLNMINTCGAECHLDSLKKKIKLNGQNTERLPPKKCCPPPSGEEIRLAALPSPKLTSCKRKPPQSRRVMLRQRPPVKQHSIDSNFQEEEKMTTLSYDSQVIARPQSRKSSLSPRKNCTLRKQRVPSMYRDPKKVYYYNKVVTPKKISGQESSAKRPYYFVLHYYEEKKTIRIIPLYSIGKFNAGKRIRHIRWKATIFVEELKPRYDLSKYEEKSQYFTFMGVKTVP